MYRSFFIFSHIPVFNFLNFINSINYKRLHYKSIDHVGYDGGDETSDGVGKNGLGGEFAIAE